MKPKTRNSGVKQKTRAERADRHDLYQKSVQAPETEIAFLEETYRALRGSKPLMLREDFCGTAYLATQWCRGDAQRTALGVDICPDTLDWGRRHNVKPAGRDVARRLMLVCADVREIRRPQADITCAFNFSYCLFKTRTALRDYFALAREGLRPGGLFVVDLFGGTECYQALKEETPIEGEKATYVWEQARFNPIDHHMLCHIHFKFPDGSRLRKAFTYDWRLWTIPEVSELMYEAGFTKVRVYWERYVEGDEDDEYLEGTGEYYEVTSIDNQESWLSYIVAEL